MIQRIRFLTNLSFSIPKSSASALVCTQRLYASSQVSMSAMSYRAPLGMSFSLISFRVLIQHRNGHDGYAVLNASSIPSRNMFATRAGWTAQVRVISRAVSCLSRRERCCLISTGASLMGHSSTAWASKMYTIMNKTPRPTHFSTSALIWGKPRRNGGHV